MRKGEADEEEDEQLKEEEEEETKTVPFSARGSRCCYTVVKRLLFCYFGCFVVAFSLYYYSFGFRRR